MTSLVTAIEIVQREKIEEEVRVEEEEEEEMSPTLGKEDNHLKEGDTLQGILHIQKEKARRKEVRIIDPETIVPTNQNLIQIDQADHNQDLNLKQNKTLPQEERNRKNMEDPTKTEEDTTKKTIITTLG